MSGFFAILIIMVLFSLPVLGVMIGIRAKTKKPIKNLLIALAITATSIVPLSIFGVLTDPATWCDHQWNVVNTVEATCTSKGFTEEKCELCNRERTTGKTSALGHSMIESYRIEPTIYEKGKIANICERCGHEQITVLSQLDPPGKNAPKKTDDGVLQYKLSDDKTYYIISDVVDASVTTVNIPASIHNVPVKTIGKEAFKNCRKLINVGIPDSIMSIEESAFDSCTSLTSVVIPREIDVLNDHVFAYCSNLTSVTLPDNLKTIGTFAFIGCRKLSSITIPKSVTSIGGSAFSDCDSLKSVYAADMISWCGIAFGGYNSNPLEYASNFYVNGEFVKEIVIPEGVTSIGAYAFSGYAGFTSITIPKSLKSIGQNAFKDCTSLKNAYITDLSAWCGVELNGYDATPLSDGGVLYLNGEEIKELVIPINVTNISAYAFYGFTTLKSVTFHSKVTSIGSCAFAHCFGITSVTVPDSVTNIGEYAFYNCYNIQEFIMGKGVSEIGDYAFDKFNSLETMVYHGKIEQWNLIHKDNLWDGYVTKFSIRCLDGIISKNGTITYD